MSDIKYDELKKNDDVIFARILPKLNVYETINFWMKYYVKNYILAHKMQKQKWKKNY